MHARWPHPVPSSRGRSQPGPRPPSSGLQGGRSHSRQLPSSWACTPRPRWEAGARAEHGCGRRVPCQALTHAHTPHAHAPRDPPCEHTYVCALPKPTCLSTRAHSPHVCTAHIPSQNARTPAYAAPHTQRLHTHVCPPGRRPSAIQGASLLSSLSPKRRYRSLRPQHLSVFSVHVWM